MGIKPDALALRKRIVNMYKTAFGAFNVVQSEGIRHPAKLEVIGVVERSCVECDNSVPTALHRYRVA